MLNSDNGVIHNYNAKDNAKSNWCTPYFHCGPNFYMHSSNVTFNPIVK